MDWWLDKVTSTCVLTWRGRCCLGGLRLCLVSPARSPRRNRRPQQLAPVCPAQELGRLKRPALMMYLLPWRQVEWVMASPGWIRSRPVQMMSSRETGLQNITGHNRGDGKTDQHFPSRSRITRGDAHQHSSSTSMQESNHVPATMWLPWE